MTRRPTKRDQERQSAQEQLEHANRQLSRPLASLKMLEGVPMRFLTSCLMMAIDEGIITAEQSGQIHQLVRRDLAEPWDV